MALGPGKYDDLVTDIRTQTDAAGVVLLVFGGNRGSGFSAQATADVISRLPKILRGMADDLDPDLPTVRASTT